MRFKQSDEPEETPSQTMDLSKRYDVYMSEHSRLVALRNVKIIGPRRVFEKGERFDILDKFIELEQADGTRVFISRHGMIRLCEHGIEIATEVVRE
jgi:hypothetical protein